MGVVDVDTIRRDLGRKIEDATRDMLNAHGVTQLQVGDGNRIERLSNDAANTITRQLSEIIRRGGR